MEKTKRYITKYVMRQGTLSFSRVIDGHRVRLEAIVSRDLINDKEEWFLTPVFPNERKYKEYEANKERVDTFCRRCLLAMKKNPHIYDLMDWVTFTQDELNFQG